MGWSVVLRTVKEIEEGAVDQGALASCKTTMGVGLPSRFIDEDICIRIKKGQVSPFTHFPNFPQIF